MATITPGGDIPATVTNDAALLVWLGLLMERLYRGKEYSPDPETRVSRCIRSVFTDNDGLITFTFQGSVVLSQDALTASSGALWEFAEEISDHSIPASFLP